MKLSAPAYQLKRRARALSREEKIPLHEALDRIAIGEGFGAWSLLAAKLAEASPAAKLYPRLGAGELVLVAARPGYGKTLFCLELAVEAMKAGHRSVFFTLEYTTKECMSLDVDLAPYRELFECDSSDLISADYIMGKLGSATPGTFVVIDYLQLLDQRRENPELMTQVRALKGFAVANGITLVFISQIDRSYDPTVKTLPDLEDVRLPNPLDLKLFDKACFLSHGNIRVRP